MYLARPQGGHFSGDFMEYDQLIRILSYDQYTGIFTWRESTGRVSAGEIAGSVDYQGYLRIRWNGKAYRAHRLAWLYVTGLHPCGMIDHKDLNKLNNRFSNLRIATRSENSYNTKKSVRNSSGVKGVSWSAKVGKWRARISVDGVRIELGNWDSIIDAKQAIERYREEHHGKFANNG